MQMLQLWVVMPRCDPQCDEARKVSCGSAILENIRVVDTLQDALADTTGGITVLGSPCWSWRGLCWHEIGGA